MDSNQILDQNVIEGNSQNKVDQNIAGKGKRFGNMIIDTIVYYLLSLLAGVFIGLTGIGDFLFNGNPVIEFLFGLSVSFLYFFGMEVMLGKTIGKLITGTIVVTAEGAKPSPKQIAGRSLARFIPFEAFSFLGDGVGWHDTLSDTRVITE